MPPKRKGVNGSHHGRLEELIEKTEIKELKHPTRRLGPDKVDAVGIARQWLALGVYPVPLRGGSKAPKGGEGWNKFRAEPKTLPQYFQRGDNVGGLWGEPSSWIVDVDLDCEEAVITSKFFLPDTFTYGRRQAEMTHRLYRCYGASTKQFETPHSGMIVEIRSTGSQSVLPPSRHPSGDLYEIQHDIAIARISGSLLEQSVRYIAAASLAAQYWPEKGSRHNYIHSFTGGLAHSGWDSQSIKNFMTAVLTAVECSSKAMEEHLQTVDNTIKNYKSGNHVKGWPALSEFISGEAIGFFKKWLKWSSSQNDVAPSSVDAPLEKQIDPRLLQVPGLVGEIAAWHSRKCFTLQPLFDLAVGIASVALMTQNRYLVSAWETPLQPYLLLLAPTAAGKDSAMTAIIEIAEKVGLDKALFSGFQSYHAMLDRIATPPYSAMWLWDEAARKLRTASRSQGSQDYQLLTYLMSLYGKANTVVAGVPGRKQEIAAVKYPFFSVIAAAQPSALIEAITDSDLSLGLVNRFVLLDAGGYKAEENDRRINIFPSKLEANVKEFSRSDHKRGEFTQIGFATAKAYGMFRDFERECRELCSKPDGAEVWGRANQNALVLAGIVAVGLNKHRPMLEEFIAEWAIAFIRWCSEAWAARVEQSSARSVVERGSKQVEMLIRNVRTYRHRCRKQSEEPSYVDRGIMPRSLLVRLVRHIRGRDLDDIITQLLISDILGTSEEGRMQTYWIKSDMEGLPTPQKGSGISSPQSAQ